ncbi:hypothetical protein M011DRAFT_458659 [Sporormia fimetaria CBS 119925]|uniref:Uncharacterized protein n=1 Tax=Sporormia fimetaria CBS 119925 TaxID=1340428 RepID=A0A6A6VBB1_9PLEO|nr:hypothetical protein M011DRAFT_458659 [Sporormia fimetaria CBS 119925]
MYPRFTLGPRLDPRAGPCFVWGTWQVQRNVALPAPEVAYVCVSSSRQPALLTVTGQRTASRRHPNVKQYPRLLLSLGWRGTRRQRIVDLAMEIAKASSGYAEWRSWSEAYDSVARQPTNGRKKRRAARDVSPVPRTDSRRDDCHARAGSGKCERARHMCSWTSWGRREAWSGVDVRERRCLHDG